MKIILLAVGKTVNKDIAAATQTFIDRLGHMAPFEYRLLPDVKISASTTTQKQKELEGRQFLSRIQPADTVVLLDERGKQYTSREFSAVIESTMANTRGNLIYIIGGPYGFSPEVYARANAKLSLSAMTFPHEMIRLFFVEQLYRAFAIMRNLPYHHD